MADDNDLIKDKLSKLSSVIEKLSKSLEVEDDKPKFSSDVIARKDKTGDLINGVNKKVSRVDDRVKKVSKKLETLISSNGKLTDNISSVRSILGDKLEKTRRQTNKRFDEFKNQFKHIFKPTSVLGGENDKKESDFSSTLIVNKIDNLSKLSSKGFSNIKEHIVNIFKQNDKSNVKDKNGVIGELSEKIERITSTATASNSSENENLERITSIENKISSVIDSTKNVSSILEENRILNKREKDLLNKEKEKHAFKLKEEEEKRNALAKKMALKKGVGKASSVLKNAALKTDKSFWEKLISGIGFYGLLASGLTLIDWSPLTDKAKELFQEYLSWDKVKGYISTTWEFTKEIGERVKPIIKSFGTFIANWWNGEEYFAGSGSIPEYLLSLGVSAWDKVTSKFNEKIEEFKKGGLSGLWKSLASDVSSFFGEEGTFSTLVTGALGVGTIATAVLGAMAIMNPFSTVKFGLKLASFITKGILVKGSKFLLTMTNGLANIITGNATKKALKEASEKALKEASEKALKETSKKTLENVATKPGFFSRAWSATKSNVGKTFDATKSSIGSAYKATKSGVGSAIKVAKNGIVKLGKAASEKLLSGSLGKILKQAKPLTNGLLKKGVKLIPGIGAGLSAAASLYLNGDFEKMAESGYTPKSLLTALLPAIFSGIGGFGGALLGGLGGPLAPVTSILGSIAGGIGGETLGQYLTPYIISALGYDKEQITKPSSGLKPLKEGSSLEPQATKINSTANIKVSNGNIAIMDSKWESEKNRLKEEKQQLLKEEEESKERSRLVHKKMDNVYDASREEEKQKIEHIKRESDLKSKNNHKRMDSDYDERIKKGAKKAKEGKIDNQSIDNQSFFKVLDENQNIQKEFIKQVDETKQISSAGIQVTAQATQALSSRFDEIKDHISKAIQDLNSIEDTRLNSSMR